MLEFSDISIDMIDDFTDIAMQAHFIGIIVYIYSIQERCYLDEFFKRQQSPIGDQA